MMILIFFVVIYGFIIGSFLTVVVDRVPRGGSVHRPPSACGHCGHRLGQRDLVPVASWLALRSRCRHCHHPIGVEPIVIELANATAWIALAFHFANIDTFDPSLAALPAFLIFASVLIAQTVIDLREHRLPRSITYTGIICGAIALATAAVVIDEPDRIGNAALGAAIAFALIGAIHLASNARYGDDNRLGTDDVILAPLLGMYLGWLNVGIVLPGLIAGFVIGAIVTIPAILTKRVTMATKLPFGPFMALGAVAAALVATLN